MKKFFSLFGAVCVIMSAASCAETEPGNAVSISTVADTETAETSAVVSKPQTFETTTTTVCGTGISKNDVGIVSETTEGYVSETTPPLCSVPTAPVISEEVQTAEEQTVPAYDPGQPDIYLNLFTTYITTETEEISFTVNCNSKCETSCDFSLWSICNGEWQPEELQTGALVCDCWNTITADSPLTVTFRPSDYGIKLKTGMEYCISKEIDGVEYKTFFSPIAPYIELEKEDIEVSISEGNIIPLGTQKLTLLYKYVDDEECAEYAFGCEYSLEKKNDKNEWEAVPFSSEASFIELAYIIGTTSPSQATTVSLSDDFYASPLTVGEYRIIKKVENITYEIEFSLINPSEYKNPEFTNGKIKINFPNGNTFTTDDAEFTVEYEYIGGPEYAEYMYGYEYYLEKLNNGKWEKVKFIDGMGFDDVGILIGTDYKKRTQTFSLNDGKTYEKELDPGSYRVVKKIENETYYIEFRIEPSENYKMPEFKKEYATVSISDNKNVFTTDDKKFILEFRYSDDAPYGEYGFGHNFRLERQNDNGKWTDIELNNDFITCDCIPTIGTEYSPFTMEIPLINEDDNPRYKEPLETGKYRLTVKISGVEYTVKFEIVSDEPELYDENGSMTLTIDYITDNGFICSLPWAYPAVYTVECNPDEYDNFCVGDNIEVSYSAMYKISEWDYKITPEAIEMSDFELDPDVAYKPVIYLYPEEETEVSVKLDYNGKLTVTYPEYGNGWNVTAMPDGTLFDENGNQYSYLFWEGESNVEYDFSKGFCVKGEDTAEFLRYALSTLGLTPREYNEFIVFWLPFMINNPYNIISFQSDCYTDNAVLTVTPEPDTVLRVFMAFMPSAVPVEIEQQELPTTERNGFTIVEWGGTKVTKP